jgi:threonyl-tRNA synthetase
MSDSPDVIYLYIPLMKELHLSWSELKSLPRNELEGLLYGLSQYTRMHQFDGYNEEEIGEMAKDRPQVRSDYYQYRELKDKYDARLGVKKQTKSVDELRGELKL